MARFIRNHFTASSGTPSAHVLLAFSLFKSYNETQIFDYKTAAIILETMKA